MKINVINGDASAQCIKCDMLVIDPPFEMRGEDLRAIIDRQDTDHLLLITTMRQLIGFCKVSDWRLSFDFVLDNVVPKKSKSKRQPHYTHSTCAYFTRNGAGSIFDRKLRGRSDTHDGNGYWPTILRAPRDRMNELGYAKNTQALTDIIGGFDVSHVCDLFAGSGTTALAAVELNIDCTLVELDPSLCEKIRANFRFLNCLI